METDRAWEGFNSRFPADVYVLTVDEQGLVEELFRPPGGLVAGYEEGAVLGRLLAEVHQGAREAAVDEIINRIEDMDPTVSEMRVLPRCGDEDCTCPMDAPAPHPDAG